MDTEIDNLVLTYGECRSSVDNDIILKYSTFLTRIILNFLFCRYIIILF